MRRWRRLAESALALGLGATIGACGADAPAPAEARTVDLLARLDAPRYATVGDPVVLDAGSSSGAVSFAWDLGDGRTVGASPSPRLVETWELPGRYPVVVTVRDAVGRSRTAGATVAVTLPAIFQPSAAASVAVVAADTVAVVSTDSDEVAFFTWDQAGAPRLAARAATPPGPRTVIRWGALAAVPCDGDAVAFFAPSGESLGTLGLPRGARAWGAAVSGDSLWLALGGRDELMEVRAGAGSLPALGRRVPAGPDPRAVAALPDGRLLVARYRSPDAMGELRAIDPTTGATEVWGLAYDPQPASDTESGGVPSLLSAVLVTPDARTAIIPGLQANLVEGEFRSGIPLTFETTLRGQISFIDLASGAETRAARRLLDNRGLLSAGAVSSRGDWLFVASRGNGSVERFDTLTGSLSGSIAGLGEGIDGLALSGDDRFLFVDASLSRELQVVEVSTFAPPPTLLAAVTVPSFEPLAPAVLQGKRLFNSASDPRLSKDGYLACAHCHPDGDQDGRVWDFTDRGEGLRNTTSLLGKAGLGDGPLHWSANFDEVQDFEHDLRGPFGGAGLLDDATFSGHPSPLGEPKAGLSSDLDALAAYVTSLDEEPVSPYRASDGSLTPGATRGLALFAGLGCGTCHAGSRLTDSAMLADGTPRLHDVGTLGPASGRRLGAALLGLDTPTLHGLWRSAPYLHDGSATTLQDVLLRDTGDRHGATRGLEAAALADLVEYLLSLDGRLD